jgi:hypothetical protein
MLAELLCSNGGIIKIPEGAKYTLEDVIVVIIYAATSTVNSVEAAVSELMRKMPDATIPSADTVFNITALNKDYAILLEGVVNRVREMGVKIGTMFLDREFFNLASILTLFSLGVDFIMAAKTNKRINKMLEQHKRKNGVTPVIFKYSFEDKRVPEEYKRRWNIETGYRVKHQH